jgi:hypothetical protein
MIGAVAAVPRSVAFFGLAVLRLVVEGAVAALIFLDRHGLAVRAVADVGRRLDLAEDLAADPLEGSAERLAID